MCGLGMCIILLLLFWSFCFEFKMLKYFCMIFFVVLIVVINVVIVLNLLNLVIYLYGMMYMGVLGFVIMVINFIGVMFGFVLMGVFFLDFNIIRFSIMFFFGSFMFLVMCVLVCSVIYMIFDFLMRFNGIIFLFLYFFL